MEAGVDVDFPVVFRTLAGLDSETSPVLAVNSIKYNKVGTVGKGLYNTELKIVDEELWVKVANHERLLQHRHAHQEPAPEALGDGGKIIHTVRGVGYVIGECMKRKVYLSLLSMGLACMAVTLLPFDVVLLAFYTASDPAGIDDDHGCRRNGP